MRKLLGSMVAIAIISSSAFPASAADLYGPDRRSERYSEVYTYEREYRRPPRVTVIEPEETEIVVIERRPVIVRRPVVVEREIIVEPRVYDAPIYAYGHPAARYGSWRHPRAYYRY